MKGIGRFFVWANIIIGNGLIFPIIQSIKVNSFIQQHGIYHFPLSKENGSPSSARDPQQFKSYLKSSPLQMSISRLTSATKCGSPLALEQIISFPVHLNSPQPISSSPIP